MIRLKATYKTISILLILASLSLDVIAQNQKKWQWARQIGGVSWDISSGVVCDSKDNLYVTGSFSDTMNLDFEKLKSSGSQDIFVARFNKDGVLKGVASAGGRGIDMATCLCITADDNLAIGGRISGGAIFDKINAPGTGQRLFISEINKDQFTWVNTISIIGDASLNMIGADKQGSIIVSGVFEGKLKADKLEIISEGKRDIFIARLSKTGTLEKLISFGSKDDDSPSSLSVDESGNVVLSGVFTLPFEINKKKFTVGTVGAKSNIFIAMFDINFEPVWVNILSGDDYAQVSSIKHDNKGNLYAAGSYNSKLHLADTILTSNGYTDGFIIKYKPDGKPDWIRNFGSWYYDYATNVNVDNLGGAIISGSLGDTLVVDSLKVEPVLKDNSALVIQFSSLGKATWADCISGTGWNFSNGSTLDKHGNLYFTGSFRNRFEKSNNVLNSFGDQDVFLAKYYNCTTSNAEIFGQSSFCLGSNTELSIKRGYTNIVWNDSIEGKYSILVNNPGQYWVNMLDKKGCFLTDTVLIIQNDLPVFSLGNDTTILVTDSILLHAPVMYTQYRWHDYSQESTYLAKSIERKPGTEQYWLEVTDSVSCNYADTISITYLSGEIDLMKVQLVTYPNPATDKIFWYLKTDDPCRLIIELIDVNGRILYHQYLKNYNPGEIEEINLNDLPSGHYNLQVSNPYSSNNFKTVRVVKQ